MSRKHLFAILVLLGAAAVAGLLALTRATSAATPAPSEQITAKTHSLDRLEASLRRALAEQPPATGSEQKQSGATSPRTIFVPSSAAPQEPSAEHEDEDGDDDHGHEDGHEDAYDHDQGHEDSDD